MAKPAIKSSASDKTVDSASTDDSRAILKRSRSNEVFIAVVGPAGAGVGTAAKIIADQISTNTVDGLPYEVRIVKASRAILDWRAANGEPLQPPPNKTVEWLTTMQNLGDQYRGDTQDHAAVARAIVQEVSRLRAELQGVQNYKRGDVVPPNGKPHAYIIDSLRHPAEVRLLRELYGAAFALVGVVCEPETRKKRLLEALFVKSERSKQKSKDAVDAFMERDADAPEKHGQHVTDTFHQSDYFVDNTAHAEDLEDTGMNKGVGRLIELMTMSKIVRPTIAETAMHHAYSAQLRSACLSRQVGAALVDTNGDIVATGTNDVPMAGGGVYKQRFNDSRPDARCAFEWSGVCSNNSKQNEIADELIKSFPELVEKRTRSEAISAIRKTRLGGLLEFSRAVHAEMGALMAAGRSGVSTVNSRLFVTTFPCHYCARHIVYAGVQEVQYIEPYPKSLAIELHHDSIASSDMPIKNMPIVPRRPSFKAEAVADEGPVKSVAEGPATQVEAPESVEYAQRVVFRPFVGVAPRLYERVFLKDREYKDKNSGEMRHFESDWSAATELYAIHYAKLEAALVGAD